MEIKSPLRAVVRCSWSMNRGKLPVEVADETSVEVFTASGTMLHRIGVSIFRRVGSRPSEMDTYKLRAKSYVRFSTTDSLTCCQGTALSAVLFPRRSDTLALVYFYLFFARSAALEGIPRFTCPIRSRKMAGVFVE